MSADFQPFLSALLHASLSAAVLVLVIVVAQRVFRSVLTPHWSSILWLLVAARLLPFSVPSEVSLFNLLPGLGAGAAGRAAISPSVTTPPLHLSSAPNTAAGRSSAPTPNVGKTAPSAPDTLSVRFAWSWPSIAFSIWLAGVVGLVGYVGTVALSFNRSLARLAPLVDRKALSVLDACCAHMGVRRRPRLIESEIIPTPALHGIWRPTLLLPAGFTTHFSDEEQRFVFLHELAHLRRRDLLLNWLVTVLQIIHWFNPVVWLGFARWRIDREIACDAAALEAVGSTHTRAYGETMLSLLQNFSPSARRPGIVGILESRRQLKRRLTMIAGFTSNRRKFAAIGLFSILALVGLSDAQVSAPSPAIAPPPSALATAAVASLPASTPANVDVLFLVSRAESMLGDSDAEVARWRAQPDAQKITAPKWVRASQTLESLIRGLAPGTSYQVTLCGETSLLTDGVVTRSGEADDPLLAALVRRTQQSVPAGQFNLELAIGAVALLAKQENPGRVVLITDSATAAPDRDERIRRFHAAVRGLPAHVPVHTVLLSKINDEPSTAGLYWQLANATRGELITVPSAAVATRTHIAFVIDTSGSMRDPNTGGLWPIVIRKIEDVLDAHPNLVGLQLVDGDGRFILGRPGSGAAGWLQNTPDVRAQLTKTLARYDQDTVSNPIPGVYNAIRYLDDKSAPDLHMGIYLFGDEFNSSDSGTMVLQRLDQLNPRDASGQHRIVINAIGFPTTIRAPFSMGNTGLRFAELMRTLTYQHDGLFIALQDL